MIHMVAVVKKTDAGKFTSLDSFNGANVGAQRNLSEGIVKDTLTSAYLRHNEKSNLDFSLATRKNSMR